MNITDAIFEHARQTPHRTAIIDSAATLCYGDLCQLIVGAVARLRDAGCTPGEVVGIALPDDNSLRVVVSLALARAGCVQTDIGFAEPLPARLARMERAGVTRLVSDRDEPEIRQRTNVIVANSSWLRLESASGGLSVPPAANGDQNWIIVETSGTTAIPKLVCATHAVEVATRRLAQPLLGLMPGENFMNLHGLRFLVALRRAIYCLCDGATLVIAPEPLTANRLLAWIDLQHVNCLSGTPAQLRQLLRHPGSHIPRLPGIRMLRSTSSLLSASAVREIREKLTPNLYNLYGTTESGPVCVATPGMLAIHPDTIGLPLPGVEFEIVDADDRPVSAGTTGRIRFRSPGTRAAYLNPAQAGAAVASGHGWWYPGDVAVRDVQGFVYYRGRNDDMINFEGIMISPAEIESVLALYPGIDDAAAFGIPSVEHQDIPAAVYVSKFEIDVDALTRHCRQRLGVRAPQLIFSIPAVPMNAAGKIVRRQLAAMAAGELRRLRAS